MHCIEEYVKLVNELNIFVANFTRLYVNDSSKKAIEPSMDEYETFLKKLARMKSRTILNVQPGFNEMFLKKCGVKEYSLCPVGKEITISFDGNIKSCPASNNIIGNWTELDNKNLINLQGCCII
jgi:MoaA/NifB/PqqE/SkfB family radical SAM enzyme